MDSELNGGAGGFGGVSVGVGGGHARGGGVGGGQIGGINSNSNVDSGGGVGNISNPTNPANIFNQFKVCVAAPHTIKALSRLYQGAIKALLRLYKAL